jgi:hypothetical protein
MSREYLENIRLGRPTVPMKKSQNPIVFIFLGLITWLFYVPYYYEKWTAKINIVARDAFGEDLEELRFHPQLMNISLIVIYGTVVLLLILVGFSSKIAPSIYNAMVPGGIGVIILGFIIFMGYGLHAINKTSNALKTIAREYELADVVVLLQFSSFLWRDLNCFNAFNEIADEYNRRNGMYSIR